MHRSALVLGMLAGVASLALIGEREARACGGCFHPPTQTAADITDERMLLSVSQTQTTLYDQIRYSGNPTSFAWVLPIKGTVTIGLSADVLFDSVDTLTATTIISPPSSCPPPPNCGGSTIFNNGAGGGAVGAPEDAADAGSVTVLKQQNVGPYATVQLASTTPGALETWLSNNGYVIPTAVQPVVAEYVTEGFDFLAMKLLPGQGVQAMQPVRVSMPGASLSLPLRMAAIGTGASVGISIWVVSEGRYEPQNFPFFHIDDSELVWDWSVSSSNYTTLRASHEAALNGKGWELESSISLAQQTVSNVVLSGGVYYGPNGGSPQPSDPSQDYLPVTAADGTVTETPGQVRMDDLNALFAGIAGPNARVTRIRSDISHAAMTTDFVLQASADQSEVSNVRNVTKSINEQCPIYGDSCSVIGYGTPTQAAASVANASPGSGPSGSSPTGSPAGGAFACNTTASSSPLGGPVTLGAAVAMLGLVVLRARRRRSRGSY
jgi:MYXO-CTERM domain-containing protein